MTGAPRVRRARFEREPVRPFQLTERDRALIAHVHRHRLLRSTHLTDLVGGSRQQVLRRLHLLFHHGYLDRPRAQLDWYTRGSTPMVYALGPKGAAVIGAPAVRWTQKNREIGRRFLHHTIAVADFLVRMELDCRVSPGVEFIPEEEIREALPNEPRPRQHPFRLRVTCTVEGRRETLSVIPDAVFGLRCSGMPSGRESAYFFLELDRGTMPLVRTTLFYTSVARKLLAYHAGWRQALHRRLFGLPNFRVLTVTTTPERVENVLRVLPKTVPTGLRLFLFADTERLVRGNLLTCPWVNGKREIASLLPT